MSRHALNPYHIKENSETPSENSRTNQPLSVSQHHLDQVSIGTSSSSSSSMSAVKPETARLMIKNHNPAGFTPRGLGFGVGKESGSRGCSGRTFGHTGSTGTLCWADPASDTTCVVFTSLPGRVVKPHPRELAAERVAAAARR